MTLLRRFRLLAALAFACPAFSQPGDLSAFGALLAEPGGPGAPAFGAEAGLQLNANERTDLQLSGSFTAGPGEAATRLLLGSYYTPYFGDIRPRLGGSAGLLWRGSEGPFLPVGLHLQGLYALRSGLHLYGEANPGIVLGASEEPFLLVKLGVVFRISR